MIRICTQKDFPAIYSIINDAAIAYKGVIPDDRWHDPYMTERQLGAEIDSGVVFRGYEHDNELAGIMGCQPVLDVTLIRHAYVKTALRNHGIGSALLAAYLQEIKGPILIGTWAAATWAVSFYRKHGFSLVTEAQKNMLLKKYWRIPLRQVETSVVLANDAWQKSVSMPEPEQKHPGSVVSGKSGSAL